MATAVVVQAPAGVKLDRSRVGTELSRLSDARIGETLDFQYFGGSYPGSIRTVLVVKRDSNGIQGLDAARNGEWRHFTNDNAENVDVVEPFAEESADESNVVYVSFADAQDRLIQSLPGEKLAELYLQYVATEGESASYDGLRGLVKIQLPKPTNTLTTDSGNVNFTNKRGDSLVQYVYDDGRIGVDVVEGGRLTVTNTNVAPDEFAVLLTRFLQG